MADVRPEDFGAVPVGAQSARVRPEDFGATPVAQSGTDLTKPYLDYGKTFRADTAYQQPLEMLNQRDPGIDYRTGVKDAGFRAGFSRMDNDAEKSNYLDRTVGKGNYGKDSFGAWYLKPEGMSKLGLQARTPVSIDEQFATMHDFADFAGSLPAIAGATGLGLMGSGMGAPAGIALSALGAAGGKGIDELVKRSQGLAIKSSGETAGTLAGEAAGAGVGEGIFRGGKFILGGYSPVNETARRAMTLEALNEGLRPKTYQFIGEGGPLIKRYQAVSEKVLGDPTAKVTREVLEAKRAGLEASAGAPVADIGEKLIGKVQADVATKEAEISTLKGSITQQLEGNLAAVRNTLGKNVPDIGERVIEQVKGARRQFGDEASKLYAKVDELAGGPIVPTKALKSQAEAIIENLPKDAQGNVLKPFTELHSTLTSIAQLPEQTTVAQMQRIRTVLREAGEVRDLVPGASKKELWDLRGSIDKTFEQAIAAMERKTEGPLGPALKQFRIAPDANAQVQQFGKVAQALKDADAFYREGIRKFDAPVVAAITRDASQTGAVSPERVLEYLIKPGRTAEVERIKGLVSPEVWSQVKRAHFEDTMRDSRSFIGGEQAVSGPKLYQTLTDMEKTVKAVYGKDAPTIMSYAKQLAARDGKIDPSQLTGNLARDMKALTDKQTKLDAFMKDNYLASLGKSGQEAEQAVEYIFRPDSPWKVRDAKAFYGANSPEFQGLQNKAMQKILDNFVARTEDPFVKVFDGAALRRSLDHYGLPTLRETFGHDVTRDLYKFADLAEFITKKGTAGAGTIVAASAAIHPLSHLGTLADFFLMGRLLRTPGVIKWLSEGIRADTPAKEAAAALARVGLAATTLTKDKTGSASVTFSAPEAPKAE